MHDDANTVATALMGAVARLRAGWCPGAIAFGIESAAQEVADVC